MNELLIQLYINQTAFACVDHLKDRIFDGKSQKYHLTQSERIDSPCTAEPRVCCHFESRMTTQKVLVGNSNVTEL